MLIVDAANVVGSRPDGWWRDRPGAAARLHDQLARAIASNRLAAPVVLVLEGAARPGVEQTDRPISDTEVHVVHAIGTGDDAIVHVVSGLASADGVTIVSADRELCHRVTSLGAAVVGPQWLLGQLDQPGDTP